MPWGRWKARRLAILPQRRGPLHSSLKLEETLTDSRPTHGRLGALSGTLGSQGLDTLLMQRNTADTPISLTFLVSLAVTSPRQQPMEEKRKHQRSEVEEPAYVSSGGAVMSCVVRNISVAGAAIDIDNPAFVPPRFTLVIAKDSSVRDCKVIWIQKNRIGIAFLAPPQEPKRQG